MKTTLSAAIRVALIGGGVAASLVVASGAVSAQTSFTTEANKFTTEADQRGHRTFDVFVTEQKIMETAPQTVGDIDKQQRGGGAATSSDSRELADGANTPENKAAAEAQDKFDAQVSVLNTQITVLNQQVEQAKQAAEAASGNGLDTRYRPGIAKRVYDTAWTHCMGKDCTDTQYNLYEYRQCVVIDYMIGSSVLGTEVANWFGGWRKDTTDALPEFVWPAQKERYTWVWSDAKGYQLRENAGTYSYFDWPSSQTVSVVLEQPRMLTQSQWPAGYAPPIIGTQGICQST